MSCHLRAPSPCHGHGPCECLILFKQVTQGHWNSLCKYHMSKSFNNSTHLKASFFVISLTQLVEYRKLACKNSTSLKHRLATTTRGFQMVFNSWNNFGFTSKNLRSTWFWKLGWKLTIWDVRSRKYRMVAGIEKNSHCNKDVSISVSRYCTANKKKSKKKIIIITAQKRHFYKVLNSTVLMLRCALPQGCHEFHVLSALSTHFYTKHHQHRLRRQRGELRGYGESR